MPSLRIYDIFISHPWTYSEDYHRLVTFLNGHANFHWRNYSVPEHDPLSNRGLAAALNEQVRRCHIVLVLSGVYASHSEWMGKELKMAATYSKPIVGVKPYGNQKMSAIVQSYANEMVNWNASSIVDAVRRNAI